MAYLNSLLGAIKEPSGFWINIIKSFEGSIGNYVLAIILLTVVIRLIWGIVDTVQKWYQQKQGKVQAKMQPELDALKKKYEKQPQVLQQKQNELQKKYMGKGMYGGCIMMLVIMALNLLIFFSLFSSLNTMAAYKSAVSYDTIKYTYVNCINTTDQYILNGGDQTIFNDYENISFVFEDRPAAEEGKTEKWVVMNYNDAKVYENLYNTDFSYKIDKIDEESGNPVINEETGEVEKITITSNEAFIEKVLSKYFPKTEEEKLNTTMDDIVLEYEEDGTTPKLYLSQAIQNAAMEEVVKVYDSSKDSFLWIKNIWISDTPWSGSLDSYDSFKKQAKGEETIFNAFMPELKEERDSANGYLILPLLCIITAILTTELTNFYNARKNKKKGLPPPAKGGKFARFIMPLILGIFALFYNSVFSIYMLVGQLMSMILMIPQLMIVDAIVDKTDKKKEEKETPKVDYSRKF